MDKRIIATQMAPKAVGPYSQAVVSGDFLFCSGQIPIDAKTGEYIKGSVADQAKKVLENLKGIIEYSGARMLDVIKVTIYLTSMDYFREVNKVYETFFQNDPPARATIAVAGLPLGFDVEMDAIVQLGH